LYSAISQLRELGFIFDLIGALQRLAVIILGIILLLLKRDERVETGNFNQILVFYASR
jgi:hypothetical protein